MHRFEEDDHEPVAVVRTLSDFALALTLVVLMLIGTRSAAQTKEVAAVHAATSRSNGVEANLNVLLSNDRRFTLLSKIDEHGIVSGAALAETWTSTHPEMPAIIVLHFPTSTLATDLHRALLDLQSAFGTNLARIDTIPQP